MGDGFVSLGAFEVMLVGIAYFAMLYFATALGNAWLTRSLLPRIDFGRILDRRPLPPGQVRREIAQSMASIVIFGAGLVLPWALLRSGWASLAPDPSPLRIVVEIIALFFWNELHFYVNHRLLHTRALRRFHGAHHRSHVPTPFSTYAFHPVEAIMLGSVPLIPMLLHDFSFVALASLPVLSVLLNSLGHANYEFTRHAPATGPLGASRRHHLHHACYDGNYGFLLPWFDGLMGSTLPLDAADGKVRRAQPAQRD